MAPTKTTASVLLYDKTNDWEHDIPLAVVRVYDDGSYALFKHADRWWAFHHGDSGRLVFVPAPPYERRG